MSYSVWISSTGCCQSHSFSPTYNLAPMFEEAFGTSIRSLNGLSAKKARKKIERAIKAMEADPRRFQRHNPPNGWGDYEGAVAVLRDIARVCKIHPDGTVEVT